MQVSAVPDSAVECCFVGIRPAPAALPHLIWHRIVGCVGTAPGLQLVAPQVGVVAGSFAAAAHFVVQVAVVPGAAVPPLVAVPLVVAVARVAAVVGLLVAVPVARS